MVHKIPIIQLDWNWVKDKKIIFDKVPLTHNYHLIIIDEEDDIVGWWLLERIERYE